MTDRLRGVIAAAATPVHPDFSPDVARLLPHLRHLLDHGCDGINLLGTTGEANSFGTRQRVEVMRAVAESGLPMDRFMVGTGVCALDETVTLTQAAADLGLAGALVLPPFFYPGIEGPALVDYVDALAGRVQWRATSLYLYHIPQNTGVPWPVDAVVEIARRQPRMRGIKDSAGDLTYARAVVAADRDLDVFPSSEATLWRAREDGFAGCISATVNLTSEDSHVAWTRQGDHDGQRAVERATAQRAILAREALVASVKAALAVRYGDEGWMRVCPPLTSRSAAQAQALARELALAAG